MYMGGGAMCVERVQLCYYDTEINHDKTFKINFEIYILLESKLWWLGFKIHEL